jgi:hypothetical protein
MDNQRTEDSGYYAEDYQDYEEFEVEDDLDDDESIEAFGEDDDDDEMYEDDDDDESIEALQEDDLDDDEGIEDYDDDEGIEDDDDDEAFEEGYAEVEDIGDDDEAFAAERSRRSRRAQARLRARQSAKRRALLMKRKARAAQIRAARNAKRTRLMLNKKLKGIRGRGRVSMSRISKARGTGYVTAILANGRRTKMMFKPTLATRMDVNRLTRQISVNSIKQTKAIRMQGKNITLLKSAQGSAVKSLTAQQLKSSKLLTKQITDGDKNLDKRITKLVSNQKKSGLKQDVKMLGKVRDQQRRSTWNSVLIASAIPLFAAYGDRAVGDNANPLTKKNLIIAGSTAGWLFADDLIDRFLTRGSKKWSSAGGIWNIAAPFANWATVYYFMKDKQHERIVTGVVPVLNNGVEQPFEVLQHIGEDYQSDFKKIKNPGVVATIQSQENTGNATGVQARISDGKLWLKLLVGLENVTVPGTGDDSDIIPVVPDDGTVMVAWSLDTMDPNDQRTSSTVSSS